MSFKLVMLLFVFLCLSFFTLPKSYPASLVGNCIKSAVQAMTGSKKKNLVLIGQEGTIDGYAAILEVLQHAVKENSPVEVVMPLQEKTFKTIFKMSLARLGNLKKISYMDVAPLADAANCDQIQKCGLLTARFFYKDYVFEATISSKKLIGENKDAFRLKFPEKINFYKQRRAAYRVDIPEDLDIMASIVRTSGLSFSLNFSS